MLTTIYVDSKLTLKSLNRDDDVLFEKKYYGTGGRIEYT